jgi:hypothetical protein
VAETGQNCGEIDMPQWRKLWTKALDSDDVNDMPDDFTRLLWLMLPLVLDREGRIADKAALVRSRVFPLRNDVSLEAVDAALEWYAERGMIRRYCVDGRRYLFIPTWHKHQGPCEREAESNYPAPPEVEPSAKLFSEWPDLDMTSSKDESRPTQDLLMTNSCTEVEVDVEEKKKEIAPLAPVPSSSGEKQPTNGLTVAGKEYFLQFNRKRWATPQQKTTFEQAECEVGTEAMLAAIAWAATKGIADIGAIAKTAHKIACEKSGVTAPGRIAIDHTGGQM